VTSNRWRKLFGRLTLKTRILLLFGAGTLVPFLCTAAVSYDAMNAIQTSKLDAGIQSNLEQMKGSLEHTISNLNHISQQLAYPGSVAKKLNDYVTAARPFDRGRLYEEIVNEMNTIIFTNPSAGLAMYYADGPEGAMFENSALKDGFALERLPLLAEYYKISYFGPHVSFARFNNQFVLSALRKLDLPGWDRQVYVYIESGFNWTQTVLQSDRIGLASSHLILDNDLRIAYSEDPLFPVNTRFPASGADAASGSAKGYFWYKGTSNQGWSIVALVPIETYNKEKNRWLLQMLSFFVLFGILSLAISWLLWHMVYKPLRQFSQEMKTVGMYNFDSPSPSSGIPEFDQVFKHFRRMKEQIAALIQEVKQKEKRRADLEVEKLLYQINPHFLMNTLDTAHWLAIMNNQKEIDHLVTSLNKLLYYNLGKLGQASTIREELDSLKQYLELQKIRYNFAFDVRIHADEAVLNTTVPRFILQPLVENALYHGLKDDGHIQVEVKSSGATVEIAVHDNGLGISEDDIDKLLDESHVKQRQTGMGIGMNYVKRTLENYYEGKAELTMKSAIGKGTSVYMSLPTFAPGPEADRSVPDASEANRMKAGEGDR